MTTDQQVAYLQCSLSLPPAAVDVVCDYIIANITTGMVLEEEEDALETVVIFYADEAHSDFRDGLIGYLSELVGDTLTRVPELKVTTVQAMDWLESYRESVKAIIIGDDIVIRPNWITPMGYAYEIEIEPRMAFGTGSHATTKGSLLAIRQNFRGGMRFLDMGTGSGVLGILADQMGASYIKAVDYDEDAVANARENFHLNSVHTPFDILLGSIEQGDDDEPYGMVVANIIRSTILEMLEKLIALTERGGILIISGLLDKDEEPISDALNASGQDDFDIYREEEWLTYTVRRK